MSVEYYAATEHAPAGAAALIVSRVSSKVQAGEDKVALKQQTKRLLNICQDRGWEVRKPLEIGASARKPESTYFGKIDALVESGEINVVVFAAVDRFSRSLRLGIDRLSKWPAAGVAIYFGDHRFNPDDPDDYAMTVIMLAMSNHKGHKNQLAALQKEVYVRTEGAVYIHQLPPGYEKGGSVRSGLQKNDDSAFVADLWKEIDAYGLEDVAARSDVQAFVHKWISNLKPRKGDSSTSLVVNAAITISTLRDWMHHGLYRGQIPYSGAFYSWPDYAIGNQDVLAAIRRKHPQKATDKRRSKDLDTRLEDCIEAVGLAQFLKRAFEDRLVLCDGCNSAITPNGSNPRGRLLVPKFTCACSAARPIISQSDIDRFSPRLVCYECGETSPSELQVEAVDGRFRISCRCGFDVMVKRSPFAPALVSARAPPQATTGQTLADFM